MKRFDQTFIYNQHLYVIKFVIFVWLITALLPIYNILKLLTTQMNVRSLVSIIYMLALLVVTIIILLRNFLNLKAANKAYDNTTYLTGELIKGEMNTFLNIHSCGIVGENSFFIFLSNENLISELTAYTKAIYVLTEKKKRLVLIDLIM